MNRLDDRSENDAQGDAEQLLDGLTRQREIYDALARLTESQAEALERDETEAAVQLANARESEMQRIESIDSDLAPLKESWPDWRASVPEALRERVQSEFRRLGDTIGAIIALDQKVESNYREHRARVTREIQRLDGSRKVQKAYGAPARNPRLVDRSR
ncbi:MAG: hypothetical protein KDC38_13800 [Planctomycetes bacterium]|nr:hypothetical protein [Planctomycetota bacterium]